MPSAFAGAVSQDVFGDQLWQASEAAGLDLRFIQRHAKSPLLAIVYPTRPTRRTSSLATTAPTCISTPRCCRRAGANGARWAHFGGISLAREPLAETLLGVIRAAKAAGAQISFDPNARIVHRDPAYRAVFEAVIKLADLLKFSDEDLSFFFPGQAEDDVLRALRGHNPRAPIVITRGAAGASLYHSSGQVDLPTVPVRVADTVGAGDALCAGLLVSAAEQPAALWTQHLQMGLQAAAVACSHAGAYAPTREDLAALH